MMVGPPSASCLARLRSGSGSLRGTNARLARVVLRDPARWWGVPIDELADAAEVSQASVVRFSRTLGYGGYREFAHALSVDLGRIKHGLFETDGDDGSEQVDPAVVTSRVFDAMRESFDRALKSLASSRLVDAAQALAGAQRAVFVGSGMLAGVARIGALNARAVGIDAVSTSDAAELVVVLDRLRDGDVIVGISPDGRTRVVTNALHAARMLGVTTVGITPVQHSPVVELSDIAIVPTPGVFPAEDWPHAMEVWGAGIVFVIAHASEWCRTGSPVRRPVGNPAIRELLVHVPPASDRKEGSVSSG